MLLAALACSLPFLGAAPSAPSTTSGPAVTIHQPAPGTHVEVGDTIIFLASATDPLGVIRLDLWVDGALVLSQTSPDAAGMNPLSLSYPLVAARTGSYALVARAYNSQGEFGESVVHYSITLENLSQPRRFWAEHGIRRESFVAAKDGGRHQLNAARSGTIETRAWDFGDQSMSAQFGDQTGDAGATLMLLDMGARQVRI